MTCKDCYGSGIVDLYHDCPTCFPKKEQKEQNFKDPNPKCSKCGGVGLDGYANPCICRY